MLWHSYSFANREVHCKCLQGFTGVLRGYQCAGISNLQVLHATCIPCNFFYRENDVTGMLQGFPTSIRVKSCIGYGEAIQQHLWGN